MHVTTLRVMLPCPACRRIQELRVAVRTPSRCSGNATPPADGVYDGLASSCSACWLERARTLAAARERLAARGGLPGTPDALSEALSAELANAGARVATREVVTLSVRAGCARPTAPTPVG